MEDLKDLKDIEFKGAIHMETSKESTKGQLAREGEALEVLENGYGIWQSVKMHKTALVYSRFWIVNGYGNASS
jgi:hypothetical protein